MGRIPNLRPFFTTLLHRRRRTEEIQAELSAYVDEQVERLVASGVPLAEARRRALSEFGGLSSMTLRLEREDPMVRAMVWVEGFGDDLRQCVRRLWQTPRFTIPAVIALGLGVAIATAAFSVVNALMLRPAPVQDGGALLALGARRPTWKGLHYFSYPNYLDLRERTDAFRGLVAYVVIDPRLTTSDASLSVSGEAVSGNYFDAFGLTPLRGRLLTAADDAPSADTAVVISSRLWHQAFGSNDAIVGSPIRIDGKPFVIAGVAPEGFGGTETLFQADVWLPFLQGVRSGVLGTPLRTARDVRVQGYLKSGVTLPEAQASVDASMRSLRDEYPLEDRDLDAVVQPERDTRPIIDAAGLSFPIAVFLLAVAGVGLLIDGSSVASLLIARASARRRDLAIRFALGASRARVLRHLVSESVLLASAGGVVGFLLARMATSFLSAVKLPGGMTIDAHPDRLVLLFTIAVAMLLGVAMGAPPALTAPASGLQISIAEQTTASSGRTATRLRERLVASQVSALTVLLLMMAMFMTSVRRGNRIDVGFETQDRVLLTLSPGDYGYSASRGHTLVEAFLERVRALPSVISAAAVYELPFGFGSSSMDLEPADQPGTRTMSDRIADTVITPGYLQSIGTPLLRGRDFTTHDDSNSVPVAIVNQALAADFWPGLADPIGRRVVASTNPNHATEYEIVGVVKTSKYASLNEAPRPFVWFPYAQQHPPSMTLVVHTVDGQASNVVASARRVLQRLDPAVVLSGSTTLESVVQARATGPLLAGAWFVGLLGAIGFIRAAFGMYSLLGYVVQLQRREFAVRMAFGASQRDVVMLLTRRGLRLAVSGLVVGVLVAIVADRLLRRLLTGADGVPLAGWLVVPSLLAAVTMAAAYLPVRRLLGTSLAVMLHEE